MQGAAILMSNMPGRLMDQSLAVCASKGHVDILRSILHKHSSNSDAQQQAIVRSTSITPAALEHARNIANAKGQKRAVELILDFLYQHYSDHYIEKHHAQVPHNLAVTPIIMSPQSHAVYDGPAPSRASAPFSTSGATPTTTQCTPFAKGAKCKLRAGGPQTKYFLRVLLRGCWRSCFSGEPHVWERAAERLRSALAAEPF